MSDVILTILTTLCWLAPLLVAVGCVWYFFGKRR